ncbi:MAG: FRG domain-containing protein [Acutalibacteraceae bacterium]
MASKKIKEIFPYNIPNEDLERFGIEVKPDDGVHRLTFRVDSFLKLDILLTLLFKYQMKNELMKMYSSFYRGVSSTDFEIKCGLQRYDFELYESEMINNFYSKSPADFNGCKSDFEMIAKMQHYGLPTRFVDFTTNPLVAVWFACQPQTNDNFSSDGLIYIAYNNIKMKKKLIDIICKLALEEDGPIFPGKFYRVLDKYERKYYFECISSGFFSPFIMPPYISKRQINQQSVFGVCINSIKRVNHRENVIENVTPKNRSKSIALLNKDFDPADFLSIKSELEDFQSVYGGTHYIKIEIAKDAKEEILSELSFRGITKEFIYPDLNNISDKIKVEFVQRNQDFNDFMKKNKTKETEQ